MTDKRLVLRATKGSPLTSNEADNDLIYLAQLSVPKWDVGDAALVGAYTIGIIVDSPVTGQRFQLKVGGTPTVNPDTDATETHWRIVNSTSTASGKIYQFATTALAQITKKESPLQSEAVTLLGANATWLAGDTVQMTTPLNHIWSFDVKEDEANPGTLLTTALRKITPNVYDSKSTALASNFTPNYTLYFLDNLYPGMHISNDAGTAWIQIEQGGSSGGGSGLTEAQVDAKIAEINTLDVWAMTDATAMNALINQYSGQYAWLVDGTKYRHDGTNFQITTDDFVWPAFKGGYVGNVTNAVWDASFRGPNNIHKIYEKVL